MDAKPQRNSRVVPTTSTFGDENLVAGKKLAHQRHKSVGNLKNTLSTAAKRTVFGDVSNTAHALVDLAPKDLPKSRIATFIKPDKHEKPVNMENQNGLKGEAFLRPPQRAFAPSVAPLAITDIATAPKPPAHSELPPQPEAFAKPAAPKRPTYIFPDQSDIALPPLETSNKQDNMTAGVDKSTKNPRHFKSQPQLRTEQQPILRRTQSRHFTSLPTVVVHAEDDVTEAPYEDALENLPNLSTLSEDHLQVPQELQMFQPSGLDQQNGCDLQPGFGQQFVPQPEASSYQEVGLSGQQSELEAASVLTEPDENWEEDEGDFYDEQGYATAHSYRSHGDNTTGGVTTMIAPKVTAMIRKELDLAKEYVDATTTEEQIEEEEWDISMVAEYGEEIFAYMRNLEANLTPNPHYMDIQTDINWSMRSVLMDWLVQVHNRLNLLPETLFLAVNCIDRFLSVKVVSLSKLQLVGATALFVAGKYEEINCPGIQEIVFMVDATFTKDEIFKAERFMLSMLNFDLGYPGPMSFLRRISKADDYDLETRTLAKYFLEVTIMDERFVGSPPSYLAAGAHCLARMMLRKGDWSPGHTHWSGYTLSQIKPLVGLLFECCQDGYKHHWAVFEKYQVPRYKHSSVFVQTQVNQGFTPGFHQTSFQTSRSLLDEFTTSMQFSASGSHQLVPIQGAA